MRIQPSSLILSSLLCLPCIFSCVEPPAVEPLDDDRSRSDMTSHDMNVPDARAEAQDMTRDEEPDSRTEDLGVMPDAAPDAMHMDMDEPPDHPPHQEHWCERVTVQSPTQDVPVALELSRAHASVRFFGVHNGYEQVDNALSDALLGWHDPELPPDLSIYQERLSEVCVLMPTHTSSRSMTTQVELRDGVAFVTPGASAPTIPQEAEAVVLDWRGLPDHAELESYLRTALGAVLDQPFTPASFRVRKHDGLADEVYAPGSSIYTRSISILPGAPITGTADTQKPLAIWTDVHMPATVAQLAGAARHQGRAALLGESVVAAMAESSYSWVGERAVVHRTRDMLGTGGQRWPDFINSDAHVWTHDQVIETWRQRGFEANPLRGLAIRPSVESLTTPSVASVNTILHPGVMRAGLLTAHGAIDLFFAFFDEVGRGVDSALPDLLARIESSDTTPARATYQELLQRLLHHLHDAHCFTNDLARDATSFRVGMRYLPIRLDYVEQRPIIDWSDEPLLEPGDEILAIEGMPVMAWMESWRERISAATPGNALRQMGSYFIFHEGQRVSMRVRKMGGDEMILDVPTQESLNQTQIDRIFGLRFVRDAGFLTDLGAPGVLYINLDRAKITTRAQVTALYDEINLADAIILDMRGYPGVWDIFQIAGALVGAPYSSPLFSNPVYEGADSIMSKEVTNTYPGSPIGVSFSGRALLLVGHGTQSFAENFSMGLVTQNAVEVVGSQSSGTNGNITGLIAPGGITVTFTGLDVRFSDGTRFHGVGIIPDHDVTRDIAQIASGEDHVLGEAIELLTSTR